MARVFVSFLGLGNYQPCEYSFRGRTLAPTRYVQAAEVEYFGASSFDRFVVLHTPQSKLKHWDGPNADGALLRAQLLALGVDEAQLVPQLISDDLADATKQWQWFEALLDRVDPEDVLVIDMTHGFRAVPIVISSALGYLQRVKRARIEAVLYGADQAGGVIVDMTNFYVIQEWADGVSRLLESADTTKLADVASHGSSRDTTFAGLGDPRIVQALRRLTEVLRNVEVQSVERAAREALEVIVARRAASPSRAEQQLLSLVVDKFVTLVGEAPATGRYDRDYLEVQRRMAAMLLEHGLLMQSFTVLRELVGSIGMAGLAATKYGAPAIASAKERGYRKRFADTFINMLQFDPGKWRFDVDATRDKDVLLPWYARLGDDLATLQGVTRDLVKVRNGFDHAWTSAAPRVGHDALVADGHRWIETLSHVIARLPLDDAAVGTEG